MNTYEKQEPEDLHLTREEVQRTIAHHLLARAKQTGEDPREIQARMGGVGGGPNLLEFLGSIKVTRERYAERYEFRPHQTSASDSLDRIRAIPEQVRQTIAGNEVVEGDAVHAIREWQELSGDRAKGLLLLGPAGAGKTLHACLLLRGNILDIDREGHIVGEARLSMHLGTGTKSDKREALSPLESTSLLVVDYMGQAKIQRGWEAAVMEFLRARWEAGKRCVLTYRGELDAFKQCYGADGWATVERFCTVVKVRRGS